MSHGKKIASIQVQILLATRGYKITYAWSYTNEDGNGNMRRKWREGLLRSEIKGVVFFSQILIKTKWGRRVRMMPRSAAANRSWVRLQRTLNI